MTGGETDTFTEAPVPTTLVVSATQLLGDGGTQTSALATASLPTSSIDLGAIDESATAALTISGLDADGGQVLAGSTLALPFSALPGSTIPIFVQRTGQFARMPGPLSDSRPMPTLGILQGQYLLHGVAGAIRRSRPQASFTILLQLAPLGSPPELPVTPMSVAFDGVVGWLIGAASGVYWDFSVGAASAASTLTLPTGGGSFAGVAGGATVVDDTGAQYIVGATRTTGAASPWVLKIDPNDTTNPLFPNGNATWLQLSAARLGASAAWAVNQGLVVAGGSDTAVGVEIVTSAGAESLQYAPDPSVGAGATALDATHMLIAGGILAGADAGVRVVNLACLPSACVPVVWPPLPTAITDVQAFSSNGTNIVVVGSEPPTGSANPGLTHVFQVTTLAVTEVATKVPHTNARAVALSARIAGSRGRGEPDRVVHPVGRVLGIRAIRGARARTRGFGKRSHENGASP